MDDGVRFVETEEELKASFKLRYKVYVECMGRLKDKGDHVQKELRDSYDETARAAIEEEVEEEVEEGAEEGDAPAEGAEAPAKGGDAPAEGAEAPAAE